MLPTDWRRRQFALTWKQAVRIDWGTILLFGGGLSLGSMAFATGLAEAIGGAILAASGGLPLWVVALIAVYTADFMTEVMSNTATANLLIPMFLALSAGAALSSAAEAVLKRFRTGRIRLKVGDGAEGWPYYAPFERIIVSAAMRERPDALLEQLADGGSLIAPRQEKEEQLVVYRRVGGAVTQKRLSRCSFVPLLKGVG